MEYCDDCRANKINPDESMCGFCGLKLCEICQNRRNILFITHCRYGRVKNCCHEGLYEV